MGYWKHLVIAVFSLIVTSGCMVAQDVVKQNQNLLPTAIQQMETAVHQYFEATGVLPIVTKERDTPLFEKYEIEMKRLYPQYLPQIPDPAFEAGGIYYFVILDPEGEQQVRAMDLQLIQGVNDLQTWLVEYARKHGSYPILEEVEPGYYTLDESEMGRLRAWIKSPLSERQLPLLLHRSGKLVVDYRPEIQGLLTEEEPMIDGDLRWLIVDETPLVPICGVPIYWESGRLILDPDLPY